MPITCDGCNVNLDRAVRLRLNFDMCGTCGRQQFKNSQTLMRMVGPVFKNYRHSVCEQGEGKWSNKICDVCVEKITGINHYSFDYDLCEDCFYGPGCQAQVQCWTKSFVRSQGTAGTTCDGCGNRLQGQSYFLPDFFVCEECSSHPKRMSGFLSSLPCSRRPDSLLFHRLSKRGAGTSVLYSLANCHICHTKMSEEWHKVFHVNYGLCATCVGHPTANVSAHFRGLFTRTAPASLSKKEALYANISLLGQGAFGKVYKAKSTTSKQLFARKVVSLYGQGRDALQLALGEASLLLSLKQANVVEGVDAFCDSEHNLNIVMELGTTDLATVIRDVLPSTKKSARSALAWCVLSDITNGVSYLHHLNVLHRDIKPANILIFTNGKGVTYKLGDLGVARLCSSLESMGTSHGTPMYEAPEMLDSPKGASTHSDMWAIGCVVYELLFATSPFWSEDDGLLGAYKKMTSGKVHIPSGTDPKLVKIIKGLLRFEPQKRLTADEVLEIFEQAKREDATLNSFANLHMGDY